MPYPPDRTAVGRRGEQPDDEYRALSSADRQRPHQTAVGPQPIQAAVEMVLPASRFTACGSGNGKAV